MSYPLVNGENMAAMGATNEGLNHNSTGSYDDWAYYDIDARLGL